MIYVLLILGLCLLAFGGDTMVSGAVALAKKMGISTLLIGLTLVGFGTSIHSHLRKSGGRGSKGVCYRDGKYSPDGEICNSYYKR